MTSQCLKKMNAIDLSQLAELESSSNKCEFCKKEELKSWSNITLDIRRNIKAVGEFEYAEEDIKKNEYTEYHLEGTSYWSPDAPIAVHFYPYHESTINTCINCNAVFLTYTEYAGHAPQNRIRYVDKNLIVG